MKKLNLTIEYERQIQNLIDRNYHKITGISDGEFRELLEPLKERLPAIKIIDPDPVNGTLPFVIVIKNSMVSSEKAMELSDWKEKPGITKLLPLNPIDFDLIDEVKLPDRNVYLLIQINRGTKYLNIRPQDALMDIMKNSFTPLTIDEGIALITHFPGFLKKNNCFSLLASRKPKDKRVPAIWINSKNEANLGWCWNGNPHTWLGSAYAESRI